MSEIVPFVNCLVFLDPTTLRRLVVIVFAMLAMTGRVTMLGISRWTEKGGSYRTVQRFFNSAIDWDKVHWLFVKHWFFEVSDTYILAGDEVVVTKAGTETYGLDKFYSSVFGKPVPGLSFFSFSLVSTTQRTAYPVMIKQLIRSETDKAPPAEKTEAQQKKGPGRPKGSKNKSKEDVELSPYLLFIQEMLTALLLLMGIDIRYVVLDGAFGTNYALQMVKRSGSNLHLISRLQYNSALFFRTKGHTADVALVKSMVTKLIMPSFQPHPYRQVPLKKISALTSTKWRCCTNSFPRHSMWSSSSKSISKPAPERTLSCSAATLLWLMTRSLSITRFAFKSSLTSATLNNTGVWKIL